MRVKVGDTWYDSEDQPICVEFVGKDKENVANMNPDCTKYAVAPDDFFENSNDFMKWMD